MTNPQTQSEPTPVDDVRRVRERLSREAGGDVRKLVEESNRVLQRYREKLGLKTSPIAKQAKRTGKSA